MKSTNTRQSKILKIDLGIHSVMNYQKFVNNKIPNVLVYYKKWITQYLFYRGMKSQKKRQKIYSRLKFNNIKCLYSAKYLARKQR